MEKINMALQLSGILILFAAFLRIMLENGKYGNYKNRVTVESTESERKNRKKRRSYLKDRMKGKYEKCKNLKNSGTGNRS